MPRPRRLHPVKPRAVPAVVECCRSLLDRAKRGEIRDIAYAATLQGGGTSTSFAFEDSGRWPHMHLAVTRLARRFEMPEVEELENMHGGHR